MSASREKKNRQELAAQGLVDPRVEREQKEAAERKKNKLIYGGVAVLFVIVAAVVLLYNSGIFQRGATAVTVDGKNFTAAEVDYFYYNALNNVRNSSYSSYMGLDSSSSMKSQNLNAMAKMLLGVTSEEDMTWDAFLKDTAKKNLAQSYLLSEKAKAEGATFDDHMQEELQADIDSITTYAKQQGYTFAAYLKLVYGSNMTVSTFKEMYEMTALASHYQEEYVDSLSYTDDELEACYEADKNSFDVADYEYISFKATADSTKDADGNTVEPTDEETAAAKNAAEDAAAAAAERYAAGETLDAIAADYEDIATYTHQEEGSYADTDLMNWVFDADRAAGDTNTVTTDSTIYFVLFHSRARQDYNVVNARHILFRVDDSTLDSTSETYEADLAALKETAHNDAEDALKKWQDDGATAELFAQMATELSADTGSTANGGLYEGITKSTSFVQEFLDWCFADGRKEGDAGVIDSSYGSHVMYLDSFGDPYWKVQATNTLKNEAYDTWLAEQSTAETITDGSGMQYVGY